jgi:hypothetical protein
MPGFGITASVENVSNCQAFICPFILSITFTNGTAIALIH